MTPEQREKRQAYLKAYRESEHGRDVRRRYAEKTRELRKQREREKYAEDPTYRSLRLDQAKAWKAARPKYREKKKLEFYGLSLADYACMLSAQGGVCKICKCPETTQLKGKVKALCVDHCHVTGVVRGLLCQNCNRGVGLLKDSPEILDHASSYLRGLL